MQKYYKILGLKEGSSKQEIEEAFNRLSKELDPEKNDNLDFFKEQYALIQEAYKELTGKDIPTKTPTENHNNLFDKDSTLVSIIKRYKESNENQRGKILNFLELSKTENKIFNDALTILKKQHPIKNDNQNEKKPSIQNKSNKIRNLTISALILAMLISYVIFLKKINDLEKSISTITNNSKLKQEESLEFWKSKLENQFPEANWNTSFKESDRIEMKDSTISFFIYFKTLKIPYYKNRFFECVYQNRQNINKYWSNYIISSPTKYNNKSEPPYLKISKSVWKKYKLNANELDTIIKIVGGLKVFHQEKKLEIDDICSKCIKDYRNNYETNENAITDFYNFISEFLEFKKNINSSNKSNQRDYERLYANLTSGMSKNLTSKLNSKIKSKPLLKKLPILRIFQGSKNGLDTIKYSLNKNLKIQKSKLQNYVNEIYSEFYETNTLRTGSTPYRYCYGINKKFRYPRSQIKVKTGDSDVIVTIKKNGTVYRHAYINSSDSYTFDVSNGYYDVYFYYGRGWNPKKLLKKASCGNLKGGFVSDVSISKDMSLYLNNQIMTYTLTKVTYGNFSPKGSSINEAF